MQTVEAENTRCKHETIEVPTSNVNKQFVSLTVHGPSLSSPLSPSYLDDMLHPWGGGVRQTPPHLPGTPLLLAVVGYPGRTAGGRSGTGTGPRSPGGSLGYLGDGSVPP